MMIVRQDFNGNYNLRAKNVTAEEMLPELVRCIDMVCKDINDSNRRQEAYSSVITLLELSSQVPYLIPDSN